MEEILKRAIATWGPEIQQIVAIEECSEVVKEICKYLRGQYNKLHMAEEIADIKIMIMQLSMIHKVEIETIELEKNSMLDVINDISYFQSIIPDAISGSTFGEKILKQQIKVVNSNVKWLEEYLKIEKLVNVYMQRKVIRLEERLNQS